MIGYVKSSRNDDDKQRKNYFCVRCGTLITNSAALVNIIGSRDHSYVNPAGIRCNFTTFIECENVLVDEQLYLEHSWFNGYGWRFLMCTNCMLHLGWKFDSVGKGVAPEGFFGVLIGSVDPVSQED